jgi:hypothetical protein
MALSAPQTRCIWVLGLLEPERPLRALRICGVHRSATQTDDVRDGGLAPSDGYILTTGVVEP